MLGDREKLSLQTSVCLQTRKRGTYPWSVYIYPVKNCGSVHGVLKARILKWFAIGFSRDHILQELSTMTHPSWVALHCMAHSFIVLDKGVVHVISLIFCDCGFHSVCPLMDKDKRFMEAS